VGEKRGGVKCKGGVSGGRQGVFNIFNWDKLLRKMCKGLMSVSEKKN